MYDATVNPNLLEEMITNEGKTLKTLTDQQPVLLIFLRHFGCVFCKEALTDLAERRADIEKAGVRIVFIHMATEAIAQDYFRQYRLDGLSHISDPDTRYYTAFGINKGSFSQLYGLRTWIRGYSARKSGHALEINKVLGDSTQMPGIFLIDGIEIKDRYIHRYASERPDYVKLVQCCTTSI